MTDSSGPFALSLSKGFDRLSPNGVASVEKPEQVLWIDPTHPHGGV